MKGLQKGCVWEVSWRRNRLQHIDPSSSDHSSTSFSFCWATQPVVTEGRKPSVWSWFSLSWTATRIPTNWLQLTFQQMHCASCSPQLDWPRPESNLKWRLFRNHRIPSPSLLVMRSFTPQSHFLSGVIIMTFVIVISSARERELYSMCAPARALSRIVQSPTKPNDKI